MKLRTKLFFTSIILILAFFFLPMPGYQTSYPPNICKFCDSVIFAVYGSPAYWLTGYGGVISRSSNSVLVNKFWIPHNEYWVSLPPNLENVQPLAERSSLIVLGLIVILFCTFLIIYIRKQAKPEDQEFDKKLEKSVQKVGTRKEDSFRESSFLKKNHLFGSS